MEDEQEKESFFSSLNKMLFEHKERKRDRILEEDT